MTAPPPHARRDFARLSAGMLAALPEAPGNGSAHPLATIDPGATGDLTVALIRAWATVGDILGFYQDRIAREGYLGTAEERLSLIELLRQVGYEFRPVTAATTSLALTVRAGPGDGPELELPAGIAAETVPVGGGQPAEFATLAPLRAREAWNALRPVTRSRPFTPPLPAGATSLQLAGTRTGLRTGSGLFMVCGGEGETAQTALFRLVAKVQSDPGSGTTLVSWSDPLDLPGGASECKRYRIFAAAGPYGLLGNARKPWAELPDATRRALGTPLGGVFRGTAAGTDKPGAVSASTGTGAQDGQAAGRAAAGAATGYDGDTGAADTGAAGEGGAGEGGAGKAAAAESAETAWASAGAGLPLLPLHCLAADGAGQALAGTAQGLYRLEPGAPAWVPAGEGLARRPVQALAVTGTGTIIAAGGRGRLYRSRDGGETWDTVGAASLALPRPLIGFTRAVPLPDLVVGAVAVAETPTGAPMVAAGTDKGILLLDEVGGAWRGANAGMPGQSDTNGLAAAAVRALLLLPGGACLAATDKGLFRAARLGAAWQDAAVAQGPAGPLDRLLRRLWRLLRRIGTALLRALNRWAAPLLKPLAPVTRAIGKLYRRLFPKRPPATGKDRRSTAGLDTLCLLEAGDRTLAGTAEGLFATEDGGLTWYPVRLGPTQDAAAPRIAALAAAGKALWAATAKGAWRSDDGGATWTLRNGALAPLFSLPAGTDTDWADAFARAGFDLTELSASGTPAQGLTLTGAPGGAILRTAKKDGTVEVCRDERLLFPAATALAGLPDGTILAATPWDGVAEADWPGATIFTGAVELDRKLTGERPERWLGLLPEGATPLALPVTSAGTVPAERFGLGGNVTRVATGAPDAPLDADRRRTAAFLATTPLAVPRRDEALPTPVAGTEIELAARVEGLRPGQQVALIGRAMGLRLPGLVGGVWRVTNAGARRIGLAGEAVTAVAAGPGGQVVAATDAGISELPAAGGQNLLTLLEPGGASQLALTGGALFAVTPAGLVTAQPFDGAADTAVPGRWNPPALPGRRIDALAELPGGGLAAATDAGVFRLDAKGGAWRFAGLAGTPVTAVAAAPDGGLLAGTGAGVVRLSDGTAEPLGLDAYGITALAVGADGLPIAGTAWGLCRRRPSGEWIEAGLQGSPVTALLAQPGGRLWAGTAEDGLQASTDGGQSWSPVATGADREVLSLADDGAGGVLAGTGDALLLRQAPGLAALRYRQPRLFRTAAGHAASLDGGVIPAALAALFAEAGAPLPKGTAPRALKPGKLWAVSLPGADYLLVRDGDELTVARSLLFEMRAAPAPAPGGAQAWPLRAADGREGTLVAPQGLPVQDFAGPGFAAIGEVAALASAPEPGAETTTLALRAPLAQVFDAATVTLCGNVAGAAAGRPVADEPLGSGDGGAAGQDFFLRQPPLAALPAATATGLASTLSIAVRGGTGRPQQSRPGALPEPAPAPEAWREVATLAGAGPADRVYTVRVEADGRTRIGFGDGVTGARLPTGAENVLASYRSGGGAAGNAPLGAVARLSSNPPSVRGVTNPVTATGGADAETLASARRHGPLSTRALGRLVSYDDYRDFALGFPGVGHAVAGELWDGRGWQMHLTIADTLGGSPTPDDPMLGRLEAAIRANRCPTGPRVSATGYRLVTFDVAATVTLRFEADPAETQRRLTALLAAALDPAARAFTGTIAASRVTALLQSDTAVRAVDLAVFAITGAARRANPILFARPARWDAESGAVVPAEVLAINPAGIELAVAEARR